MPTAKQLVSIGILWGALAVIVVIAAAFGVPMIELTKDPLQLFESDRFYYGLLSHLGVVLSCSTAAITLFTSRLLVQVQVEPVRAAYLRVLGLLTMVLMLDDLLLVHETVAPVFLGIPEHTVTFAYALALGWMLTVYRRHIVEHTPYVLLAIALGCLAASAAIDWLPLRQIGTDVEDGLKLTGIVFDFQYCVATAAAPLMHLARRERALAPGKSSAASGTPA
jgi:hypothetical protein